MMPQVDPKFLVQLIKNGKNPQQLMMSILNNQASNSPVYQNLLDMAKQGRTQDIERFARNLVESQGLDFDKEFKAFRDNLGL